MSVKIQTRSINPTVFNDLLTAGTDPLIARLCAARDVQSPAELDDKLAALLPYQTLTNCEAAVSGGCQAAGDIGTVVRLGQREAADLGEVAQTVEPGVFVLL